VQDASRVELASRLKRTRAAWILVSAAFLISAASNLLLYFRASADQCYWDGPAREVYAALIVAPPVAGILSGAAVVVGSPGRLRRSRWRHLVAAVVTVAVVVAVFYIGVGVSSPTWDHTCD